MGVGIGVALPSAPSAGQARAALLGWLAPALLIPPTIARGHDWVDDAHVFGVDLVADPSNPYAAFHVAWDLQSRRHDCADAIPLYRQALDVEPRAVTNLQACLADRGDWAGVVGLADRSSTCAGAMNTARAYVQLGRLDEAVRWSLAATGRDPARVGAWELRGRTLANAGRWPDAIAAFDRGLALEPGNPTLTALRAAALSR